MRIDKYLKISRIIKRRTVALDACKASRVMINGKVAKPSDKVSPGDIVEIRFGNKTQRIKVVSIQEVFKKDDATKLYEQELNV